MTLNFLKLFYLVCYSNCKFKIHFLNFIESFIYVQGMYFYSLYSKV